MLSMLKKKITSLFNDPDRIHRYVTELEDEELHELFEILIGEPISSDSMKISKFIRPGQGYVNFSFIRTKYSVNKSSIKQIYRTATVQIRDDFSIVFSPGEDYKGNIDLFVEQALLFLQINNCKREIS